MGLINRPSERPEKPTFPRPDAKAGLINSPDKGTIADTTGKTGSINGLSQTEK